MKRMIYSLAVTTAMGHAWLANSALNKEAEGAAPLETHPSRA